MNKLCKLLLIGLGTAILWGNLVLVPSPKVIAQTEIRQDIKQQADQLFERGNDQYAHSDFQGALISFQQSLELYQQIGDLLGEGKTSKKIGGIYQKIAQYSQAISFYEKALEIYHSLNEIQLQAELYNQLGMAYEARVHSGMTENREGDLLLAVDFLKQGLILAHKTNDFLLEGNILTNLGGTYSFLDEHHLEIDYYEQALSLYRKANDDEGEMFVLRHMAIAHYDLGQYSQALSILQEVLLLLSNINSRNEVDRLEFEGGIFSDIGAVLAIQERNELAIIFYKQAIDRFEVLRRIHQDLPRMYQESYFKLLEASYRDLASLLLMQNRILESQRVLDLIKVKELDGYFQNVRGNSDTEKGTGYLPPEENLIALNQQRIQKIITNAQTLTNLEQIPPDQLNDSQRQELITLREDQTSERKSFRNFLNSPEVQTLIDQLRKNLDSNESLSFNLAQDTQLKAQLQKLQQHGQKAAIIYPLILEDRIEIVMINAETPPLRQTIPISRTELNQTILKARQALTTDPNASVANKIRSINYQESLAQLYDWLIQPIEPTLQTAGVDTLIYAPDGALRYIPLAALYDAKNEKWLVEKYRINNITALSLTDLDEVSSLDNPNLIAGAFPNNDLMLNLATRQEQLEGLPYATQEIETLAKTVPHTSLRLNEAFNKNIVYEINSYDVVHFATHAKFVSGKPWESYIAFGNGEYATLEDVQDWDLSNVGLVVLSACETGVGDILGNGVEVLGLGYQMQQRGADATLATLWSVNDQSTQLLMNQFYQQLLLGNMTKAEALRQAQLAIAKDAKFSHPYYWSPFILIGNGL